MSDFTVCHVCVWLCDAARLSSSLPLLTCQVLGPSSVQKDLHLPSDGDVSLYARSFETGWLIIFRGFSRHVCIWTLATNTLCLDPCLHSDSSLAFAINTGHFTNYGRLLGASLPSLHVCF